ncbi:adenylate/guanylate cyclase domain-containing protein [Thalassospira lucentensis]|uniref:adenylate/guanylate cyclase domain-containing protein n=1 Tax=Thalassospira lucentensis TaxID=168935 RepID=UPI00142E04F9|nr:adenylate/guanylate cyclase domain-containing protein [Thalassospira lucentensis]
MPQDTRTIDKNLNTGDPHITDDIARKANRNKDADTDHRYWSAAPATPFVLRYIRALIGMAIIDVCFSGAYVLISGNTSLIWRAALVNITILVGLNALGAWVLFRPISHLITGLNTDTRQRIGPGVRRLRHLALVSSIWAFVVGVIYSVSAFGLGVFNTNPELSEQVPAITKLYGSLWFAFAYAAHFAIYAFFAAAACCETIKHDIHTKWGFNFRPGRARIGYRLAVVILALTLISSLAILLDLTVFREIRATQGLTVQQAVILDVIATETAAVLCLYFITRTLTSPIGRLTEAVRDIRQGKVDTRIAVTSDDEAGKLAFEFNRMADGLSEKDRMRRAFERYVSQDVVHLAMERERNADPRAGGELRYATVMFTDISGFTRMAEQLEPAQVISLLNEYFDLVNAPIRDHGGAVLNYVGDALHAAFNVVHDDPDHAANAVRAGIAMQKLSRDHVFAGGQKIKTRIGIHTGPVVAGPVGSRDRVDFTIQGDAANLASRLENMNKETRTEILISATTKALCGAIEEDGIAFRDLGTFDIRGRTQTIDLFTIDI